MNWDWVNRLNVVNYKAVNLTRLWVGTAIVLAIIVVVSMFACHDKVEVPAEIVGLWLGALCALSGVGAYTYKTTRETDYEALRIKSTAAVPSQVTTVQPGAVAVNAPAPSVTNVNADAGADTP